MNGNSLSKHCLCGSVDRTKVICTYCRHEMSRHWSSSSLKYHLQPKYMADAILNWFSQGAEPMVPETKMAVKFNMAAAWKGFAHNFWPRWDTNTNLMSILPFLTIGNPLEYLHLWLGISGPLKFPKFNMAAAWNQMCYKWGCGDYILCLLTTESPFSYLYSCLCKSGTCILFKTVVEKTFFYHNFEGYYQRWFISL